MSNKNQLDIFYSDSWKEKNIKITFNVDETKAVGNYFGEYLLVYNGDTCLARLEVPGFKPSSIIGQNEWNMMFNALSHNLSLSKKEIVDMVKDVVPIHIFDCSPYFFY
jgi:hypothetical protein